MILYSSTAGDFKYSVDNNQIVDQIEDKYINGLGRRPIPSERSSWNNSMNFMEKIIRNSEVPNDCGVLIEYTLPLTSKRVDFIITGKDSKEKDNFVIIELKQWEKAKSTDKEHIVNSFVGGGNRDMAHPSYQAWAYKQLLQDMNEAVYSGSINSNSCAYLHNYKEQAPEPLKEDQYQYLIENTPIFFRDDNKKLQEFLHKHVGKGKGMSILYSIENGRIKPSKKLIEHVGEMFVGNQAFILLDEQKVAYSTIIKEAAKFGKKKTIIVKGGPGTGKSVVSMNAFGYLLKKEFNVKFVAPNASFREVLLDSLTKSVKQRAGRIKVLFSGSGKFFNETRNTFDVLIVDEAHRLKGKGAYMYAGVNQIDDIVNASLTNVFFVDDSQKIRPDDIGSVETIKEAAKKYNSEVYEIELEAQFRCSGAQGFINWTDTVLQIRNTGNFDGWDQENFHFEIVDSPNTLFEKIQEKIKAGFHARILAGYAWDWSSEKEGNKNGEISDICIPEHNFSMPWNGRAVSTLWAVDEAGINQIGCVHTSQGLEFDYVGVIIGNDLKFDSISMTLYSSINEYKDKMGKRGLKDKPVELTKFVSNIYKVLMSRGMKGCYVYCRDKELEKHFKERLKNIIS
jgi:DUF2075 family protein